MFTLSYEKILQVYCLDSFLVSSGPSLPRKNLNGWMRWHCLSFQFIFAQIVCVSWYEARPLHVGGLVLFSWIAIVYTERRTRRKMKVKWIDRYKGDTF